MTSRARDKLIEIGLTRFAEHGYWATSVDDICRGAGVSKGSFYHFFPGKEDLGLAVLRAYYDRGMAVLMDGDFVGMPPGVERALAFLKHVEALSMDHYRNGCLMGTLAMDLGRSSPRVQAELQRLFLDVEQALAELLAPLADERSGLDPAALARQYAVVLQGAIVLSRAFDDLSCIPEALCRFRVQLLGSQPEYA